MPSQKIPDEMEEFQKVAFEFKALESQMKDPIAVGLLLTRVSQEKTSFNLLLREINAKLDRLCALEERICRLEEKFTHPAENAKQQSLPSIILSETEEEIMALVQENGKVCAQDVKARLGYKGTNAACARLSKLFLQGLLEKKQAGKKVFYVKKA